MNDTLSAAAENSTGEATAASHRPLRVLHVTSGNLYGGVETILATLAERRKLCPEMAPSFAVCFEGRLSRELAGTGAAVHPLRPVRVRHPWTVLRARRALSELLGREPFDVVICHMAWTQAIFGPVVRAHGLPLIYYLHNRTDGRNWAERWARLTVTPDLVLCVSQDTARTCPNLYPDPPSQVFYSPLPLKSMRSSSAEERDQVRSELATPPDATVIIQVSRMEAWKGQTSLLEALARLRDRPEWVCWMVGGVQTAAEAAYADSLRQLAERSGITGRVRFLGERSDVPRLLGAADVFCQPNRQSEGFSIVFMEAFLASLPIVTTAIGGALELVDESCGVLLPMQDLDALTRALERLIADPGQRTALGRAGNARVHQMCDAETQLRKLHGILAAAAQGPFRSSRG